MFSSSTTKSPLKSLGLINSDEDELSGINIDASTSFDISNANQDTSFNLIEFDCKRVTEEEFVIETQTEDEQADPGFGQFSNASPVKDVFSLYLFMVVTFVVYRIKLKIVLAALTKK